MGLDTDGSGELSIEEFIRGVVLMQRGNEPAKSGDVLSTMMSVSEVQRQLRDLQSCANEMKSQLRELIAVNSKDSSACNSPNQSIAGDLYTQSNHSILSLRSVMKSSQ